MTIPARWASFERWLDERESPLPLALFRLLVGLVAAWAVYAVIAPGVDRIVWVGPEHGGYDAPDAGWLIRLLGGPTPGVIRGLGWATVAASLSLAAGVLPRASALGALLGSVALFQLDRDSGGGHDALLTNALWLLCLARSGEALSPRCWRRHHALVGDTPVPAWPRRLAVLQLGFLYFTAGIHKVGSEWMPWGQFSALYYTLQAPHLLRADIGMLVARFYPLTQIATAVTMLFEVGLPLWMLAHALGKTRRDPRPVVLAVGLPLHLGIWLFMDLGPFSAASLAYYPCLLSFRRLSPPPPSSSPT